METKPTNVEFTHVSTEFQETFGYVRQDIKAIRKADLGLNYTVILLICCACQMLAWHKNLDDHEVFTSLLPEGDLLRPVGKMIFEALRNGLAHRFRPDTLRMGNECWRFSISSKVGTPVKIARGNPNWLLLSAGFLEDRMVDRIDAYEQELRGDPRARVNFLDKSRRCIKEIPAQAVGAAAALRTLVER